MDFEFEWDSGKAESNFRKHGVHFEDVSEIWRDILALEMLDDLHSVDEERWIRIGTNQAQEVLVVVFSETFEFGKIRIISARKATTHERRAYEQR